MENVRENMETYLDLGSYLKLKENQEFIEEAAYLLRTYLDKNSMDYEFAIAEAIKDAAESIHGRRVRGCGYVIHQYKMIFVIPEK